MSYHEPTVTGALSSLRPGAAFTSQSTGSVEADYAATEWLDDSTIPSLSEVQAEIARIEAEEPSLEEYLAATEYQRLRAPEYPPLTDLADAIYWNEQGDPAKLAAYVAACEAVKAKYPKP